MPRNHNAIHPTVTKMGIDSPWGEQYSCFFHSGSISGEFKKGKCFPVVFCHFMRAELDKVIMWAGHRMSCK